MNLFIVKTPYDVCGVASWVSRKATQRTRTADLSFTNVQVESCKGDDTKDLAIPHGGRAAPSAASGCRNGDSEGNHDADLDLICERWEHLPEAIRSTILVLVKSVKGEGE